ncbi:MAG: lysostaphin resistance A-like protein [Anaerolineae bacterium]
MIEQQGHGEPSRLDSPGRGEAGRTEDPGRGEASRIEGSSANRSTLRLASPLLSDVPWTLQDVAWATLIFGFTFGSLAVAMLVIRAAQTNFAPESSRNVSGVMLLILESALVFPVWLFTVRKYRIEWTQLGFRSFNWAFGCSMATLLLMGSFVVNAAWAGLLSLFDLQVQPDILPVFGGGLAGLTVAWLAAGLVAPLVEETFFRGFLLPALLQRYRFWPSVLIDGLVFAFIHFTPTAIVPLFVLGMLLCVLYRITNSLWPSIILHATMNTLAIFAAYAVEISAIPALGN